MRVSSILGHIPGTDAVRTSLLQQAAADYQTLAEQHRVRSIAFPCISTGVYAFPMDRAARIAVRETRALLQRGKVVEKVLLVCFGREAYQINLRAVHEVLAK